MNSDQLRQFADRLEPMAAAPGFDGLDVPAFCAWLRQCAEQRPDGWQLVPVEPTEAMKSAGGHVNSEWLNDDAPLYESRYAMPMDGVWSAMLAAAPAVPQADALPVALVRAYNAGYMAGHHDTVEGGFVDIHPSDMDTYHADVVAELGLPAAPQAEPKREPVSDSRPCTCHPDDNPPVPCAQKYALSECRAVHGEPTEAQIKARDALLDFISENGTASEGVQHYLDRYVRAAPAANLQAIHHIIEARRVELRHGTLALVRATFAGFKALPAPAASDWWTVLGVEQTASLDEARAAYRRAASAAHPDRGGTDARMAEVNRAWEQDQEAQR